MLQLSVGFTVGFLTFQIGSLITMGAVGNGYVPGIIVIGLITVVLTYLCIRAGKAAKAGEK